MITADPHRRAATFDEVCRILERQGPSEDHERLVAFARVAFAEMPDAMALTLEPPALAARLAGYFQFVTSKMPPEHQLYRGLPGIHVVVRNPSNEEEAATGSASGHHHETTIVETHLPDAPFIFESLKNFFQKEGLRVFSAVHPIFTVRRQWERVVWVGGPTEDGSRELYTQFRIERVESRERLRRLEHQVHALLKSVILAVEDFPEMSRVSRELADRVQGRTGSVSDMAAARAFLTWLLDENYVHVGMLRCTMGSDGALHPTQDVALGAFRDPSLVETVFPGLNDRLATHLAPRPDDDRIVHIDFCTNAGAIHFLDPIDDLVIREWAPDGRLAAATVVLGRLAKSAFTERAQDIPLLREKVTWLLDHSGALPNSHAYREIRAIFNHFPKRELFYADVGALKTIIDQMAYMASDDEIAVVTRAGEGYAAASIAFSDTRYSHRVEEDLKAVLAERFGPISFNTWADCGTNGVLVYYFDQATLEHPLDPDRIRDLTRRIIMTWEDRTALTLERAFGPTEGRRLFKKYVRNESRSGLYRETTAPEEVPEDLKRFERLEGRMELAIEPRSAEQATLKLFSPRPMPLTEMLTMLQNLGLAVIDEMNIPLVLPDGRRAWLERLRIEGEAAQVAALVTGEQRLLDAIRALQEGRGTDDSLNALVLAQDLGWREVEILRTFRNHLLQIRPAYNAETLNGVLLRNGHVSRALFDHFAARFDPRLEGDRRAAMDDGAGRVRTALRRVGSLLDDELLRGLDNLIESTVRTNYYQHPERPVFSVKVDCGKVERMVSPRPMFEIYVHSRLLEGIHLRGGKVARGGLRWSDRHDDFRTEVLGLMKTQMVKNSIIVPVGSKGGFVLKGDVPPRPALDAYLIDRYRQFISGLLDVTDNLVNAEVVHPPEVVFHDEPDPYLVVAADKGTAHLSDTANAVSAQYGFWLGDAFASGGSVGYDHKKEGITARGAWECVREHFRNLGTDIQKEPFTAVGIGDMSGDVFGNGMLLSRATRLLAAFNHQHIFIDPDPDIEASFAERERLFALPRSTWRDYDASLISAGGGIFDRAAKSIPISPQMRALLEIEGDEASGEEVIRRILMAKVDLLYNGGIGTYIKASSETDQQVGDRTNDRVRIDANQVRARVVGEGGNLGLTQRARIEYWTHGGRVNTDAVDNSGGVDMSDHEVNIKILLDVLLRSGVVRDRAERNAILAEMTDEVSSLVLLDNQHQARALTLAGLRSINRYDEFIDLIDDLVARGIMNRKDDGLPSREELLASPARERGIPRPVLAVMLGHMKNWAFREVMATSLPDSPVGEGFLHAYFPRRMRESFAEHFATHPLRREIVATCAVNHLVNHAGISFLPRVMGAAGAGLAPVVEAYLEVDRASRAQELREAVLATGMKIEDELQALLSLEEALEGAVRARLEGKTDDAATLLDPLRRTLGP